MARNGESKVINIRVSEAEKRYFTEAAETGGYSLSDFLRYELQEHYLERERAEILQRLKANASGPESADRDARRAEHLKQLLLNISAALRWYRNKIKHFNRQVDRLEKTRAGFEQFEAKMQNLLES